MGKCEICGARILFGPVREGRHEYCSPKCRDQDVVSVVTQQLPEGLVTKNVLEIHEGSCPACGGEGPIDVHVSHKVWSLLVLTQFKTEPKICCSRCGRNARIKAILFSGLFGWWGFPWGVLGTPVQIFRNLGRNGPAPNQEGPSPALHAMVSSQLASQYLNISITCLTRCRRLYCF